ncbi:aldose 1-epimerase family protein [Sediminibacterium ginsengisoli]|uniref:Galactose mutarotase n=1 Tax=Sediminibacterium ginsengisoli TaxID=413434 RepID=A0A1T4JXG8_9BACT|nr:aldose 1-epimerase family protein [Sediminibacterium ginsengisoli]SJZ34861.1 Galactose mutarotase [Sediminibacterium ginsengisoli]
MSNGTFTLTNKVLSVTVAAKGAELQSIRRLDNGLEYMWKGDPAFWGKKSPVLFPVVGGLKNGTYEFEGRSYQLGRHGFAREQDFECTEQTETKLTFTLSHSAATLAVYPFRFRFSIIYTLSETTLDVHYKTENTGTSPLFFSVGAHPAFAIPLTAETAYSDWQLVFSHNETAGKWPVLPEGVIAREPVPFFNGNNSIPLTKELFSGDALVFKNLASDSISIRSHRSSHGLTVQFAGFPYMGIWSSKNADFVCIEPWCGIADSEIATGKLEDKEGIQRLEAGQASDCNWRITVF